LPSKLPVAVGPGSSSQEPASCSLCATSRHAISSTKQAWGSFSQPPAGSARPSTSRTACSVSFTRLTSPGLYAHLSLVTARPPQNGRNSLTRITGCQGRCCGGGYGCYGSCCRYRIGFAPISCPVADNLNVHLARDGSE